MLKIALPNKGRLADDTRELFGDAGLPVLSRGDRALSASLGGEFEALFVRAQDIPEFVADVVADVGVTGWDLVCEAARPVERRLDLGFGECRLIAAAREDSDITSLEEIAPGTRVATSFPKITRDFFAARSQNVEIVAISGAAEIAPLLDRRPEDASILFAQLRLSVEDSRAVAAELWELDGLAARYRALALTARNATEAARRRPPTGAAAVVGLATATLPIYEAIRDDPGLPPQLLPPEWPQPELRAALTEALRCLAPGVRSYIEHLRSELTPRSRR